MQQQKGGTPAIYKMALHNSQTQTGLTSKCQKENQQASKFSKSDT